MITFLIVDDDADDRDMLREAVEEVSATTKCYAVPNGRRAIEALDEGEFNLPNLIFLDVNMPVMNGWQCLTKLKETEAYKAIPVIMYSTSSYPEEKKKAMDLGAVGFFTKPSNFTKLTNTINVIINHLDNGSLPADEAFAKALQQ